MQANSVLFHLANDKSLGEDLENKAKVFFHIDEFYIVH